MSQLLKTCACSFDQVGDLLGEGAFGAVHRVCQNGQCDRMVVKIMSYVSQPSIVASFAREIYFAQYLSQSNITPVMHSAHIKGDEAIIVYNQCRPYMDVLTHRIMQLTGRAPEEMGYVIITDEELFRMTAIATGLGRMGVVHGDNQFSQYLVSCSGQDAATLYLTDFGLAFDDNVYRPVMADWYASRQANGGFMCHDIDFDKILSNTRLCISFNLWLLEQYILSSAKVMDPLGTVREPPMFTPILPEHRVIFEKACTDFRRGHESIDLEDLML